MAEMVKLVKMVKTMARRLEAVEGVGLGGRSEGRVAEEGLEDGPTGQTRKSGQKWSKSGQK
jgi:hypothetical protein